MLSQMTLGKGVCAYAATLAEEVERLEQNMHLLYEQNMGATAIGTGINSDPEYPSLCVEHLRKVTGLPMVIASNMIEATNDTGAFIMNSSAMKRLAAKLSKICNDLRLLSRALVADFTRLTSHRCSPVRRLCPARSTP